MKINKFGTCTEADVLELEKKLGLALPEDYKRFLMFNNGGVVEKDDSNSIYVDVLKDYIIIDVLYGYKVQYDNTNILHWKQEMLGDIYENAVIIGDVINKGFIVLICEGTDKGVYYWDDAYSYEISDDEGNMYFIAKTFSDLY